MQGRSNAAVVLRLALVTVAAAVGAAAPAQAATFEVTSGADAGAGTLRAAADAANATAGVDTISIRSGVNPTLTGTFVRFTEEVVVVGQGARSTTIRQTGPDRVLGSTARLTVRDATVTGGLLVDPEGVPGLQGGGAVAALVLVLERVALVDNAVSLAGEALGGGAYAELGLTVTDSLIARNDAHSASQAFGGGLFTFNGTTRLSRSTVATNHARTSPFSAFPPPNFASSVGGGIFTNNSDGESLHLHDSTVVGNEVSTTYTTKVGAVGGNIAVFAENADGGLDIRRSIIANGRSSGSDPNCRLSTLGARNDNLEWPTTDECISPFDGTGGVVNDDPEVGPLSDNGGPTDTMLPAATSPALAAVPNERCPAAGEDQRGRPRPVAATAPCDIGAVEAANTAPRATVRFPAGTTRTNDVLEATIALSDPEPEQALRFDVRWKVGQTVRKTELDRTSGTTSSLDLSLPGNGSKGETVTVEVVPQDPTSTGRTATASRTIANSSPSGEPRIQQAVLRTRDVATVAVTPSDPDGDPVTVTTTWSVGATQKAVGPTYDLAPAGNGDRGQGIGVVAVLDDGSGPSLGGSDARTVVNSAPVVTLPALAPATFRTEDRVTATTTATDADGDPLALTWRWTVNGTERQLGASDAYDLAPAGRGDKGEQLGARVTADDGAGGTSSSDVRLRVVADTPPVLGGLGLVPEAPGTDDVLAATALGATDADGEAVSVRWRWTTDDAERRSVTTETTEDRLDLGVAGNGDPGQLVRVTAVPVAAGIDGDPQGAEARVATAPPPAPDDPAPGGGASPSPAEPSPATSPPVPEPVPGSTGQQGTAGASTAAPVPGTTATAGAAPEAACRSRRVITVRLLAGDPPAPGLRVGRRLRGARILSARLSSSSGRRGRVQTRGRQALRVDLRSLPLGRSTLTVRIAVRGPDGRTRTIRRTVRYRTCA